MIEALKACETWSKNGVILGILQATINWTRDNWSAVLGSPSTHLYRYYIFIHVGVKLFRRNRTLFFSSGTVVHHSDGWNEASIELLAYLLVSNFPNALLRTGTENVPMRPISWIVARTAYIRKCGSKSGFNEFARKRKGDMKMYAWRLL